MTERASEDPDLGPDLAAERSPLRLSVAGTTFRTAGFHGLSRSTPPGERAAALTGLRAALGAAEVVLVSTCNRLEVYVVAPAGAAPCEPGALAGRFASFAGAAPEQVFTAVGLAAVAHLFAVVASLDSLVVGETEIVGQVRRAADEARAAGLDGPFFRWLHGRAAHAARRVRAETRIGRTPVSIASLCARRIREHFDGGPIGAAFLIGVGEMTRKIGLNLAACGARVTFVNRTLERAEALAAECGGRAVPLGTFLDAPPLEIDVLVSATGAPSPLVRRSTLAPALARRGRRDRPALLVCDLAVTRDVDAAVEADPRVLCLTLADLEAAAVENRRALRGEIATAHAVVADEVARLGREHSLRSVASVGVAALLARRLRHLRPEDRATLRGFAVQLAERICRQPDAPSARPAVHQ